MTDQHRHRYWFTVPGGALSDERQRRLEAVVMAAVILVCVIATNASSERIVLPLHGHPTNAGRGSWSSLLSGRVGARSARRRDRAATRPSRAPASVSVVAPASVSVVGWTLFTSMAPRSYGHSEHPSAGVQQQPSVGPGRPVDGPRVVALTSCGAQARVDRTRIPVDAGSGWTRRLPHPHPPLRRARPIPPPAIARRARVRLVRRNHQAYASARGGPKGDGGPLSTHRTCRAIDAAMAAGQEPFGGSSASRRSTSGVEPLRRLVWQRRAMASPLSYVEPRDGGAGCGRVRRR